MDSPTPLDFETVCRYVGQLFLETRHELERLSRESIELRKKLTAAEDDTKKALQLLPRREL